jgi:hypothetical protein
LIVYGTCGFRRSRCFSISLTDIDYLNNIWVLQKQELLNENPVLWNWMTEAKWFGSKRTSCRMACDKYRHKPLKHFSMVFSVKGGRGLIYHGVSYKQSGSVASGKTPQEGKNSDGERDGEIAGPVALRVSKLLRKRTILFSQSFGGAGQLQTSQRVTRRQSV